MQPGRERPGGKACLRLLHLMIRSIEGKNRLLAF